MFTWICPTCGREVPPSYDACPDCAARAKAAAEPAQASAPPPPAPAGHAPPPAAPVAPVHAIPPQPHADARTALPTWLLTIVFAFAFAGLGGGIYWIIQHFRSSGVQSAASVPGETLPVKGSAKANPLQKYVEIAGIRFVSAGKNQTEARFVIVNHSGADINGLAGSVNIWGRTVKSEEEAAGNFTFKLPSLGAYEAKEMTAPVTTKLKVYELPDWQNVSTDLQITAP